MYTITTRQPTAEEQRLIAGRAGPDTGSYGCTIIFFGIAPVVLLGMLGGWLGGFISPDVSMYGRWVGWLIAIIYFVYMFVAFLSRERRRRQLASRDHEAQNVQDVHIIGPRVIEIGLVNDHAPIVAFDIGDQYCPVRSQAMTTGYDLAPFSWC